MKIRPINFKDANAFVVQYHRHNTKVVGNKFSVSVVDDDDDVVGVAICGRPVSRYLDDGKTLEIYRNCTDGTRNACSMLYGACVRIARDMGYQRVTTYTLASESGASLKASNFALVDDDCGGHIWHGKQSISSEKKCRWEIEFK